MTVKGYARVMTCGLRNDIWNLVNFHATSQKPENLLFGGLLLSIASKVLEGKVQKIYVS